MRMKSMQLRNNAGILGYLAAVAVVLSIFIGFVVGWIANIVQIANTEPFVWSFLMIIKIIGIFMAPLGAVMGLIGLF